MRLPETRPSQRARRSWAGQECRFDTRQTRATMPHIFRAQTHFGPHARIHPELSGGNGCDGSGGSFMLSIQATVLLIESKDVRLSMALFAVIFIYACLDKGQILTYLGWVKPRRKVYWIYAAWQVHLEHALLSSFCTEHVFLWARRRQRNCCTVLPWGRLSRKQFFAERHSQQYMSPPARADCWRTGGSDSRSLSLPCSLSGVTRVRLAFRRWSSLGWESPMLFSADFRTHASNLQLCDCDRNDSLGWSLKGLFA